jgi:hypothetical protein
MDVETSGCAVIVNNGYQLIRRRRSNASFKAGAMPIIALAADAR